MINSVIRAELTGAFATKADLDDWLAPDIFDHAPLPRDASWFAGTAFRRYRRSGGVKTTTLPDFFIGAHAECEGLTIVTRDTARFRTYFPNVPLITP